MKVRSVSQNENNVLTFFLNMDKTKKIVVRGKIFIFLFCFKGSKIGLKVVKNNLNSGKIFFYDYLIHKNN